MAHFSMFWFSALLKAANLGCVWFGDEVVWDGSIQFFKNGMVPSYCLVEGIEWSLFFVWLGDMNR